MGIRPLSLDTASSGGDFLLGEDRTGSPCDPLMTQHPGAFGVTFLEVGSPCSLLDRPPPPPPPGDCSAIPKHFLDSVVPWVGKAVER